jgi:hypothetical protein
MLNVFIKLYYPVTSGHPINTRGVYTQKKPSANPLTEPRLIIEIIRTAGVVNDGNILDDLHTSSLIAVCKSELYLYNSFCSLFKLINLNTWLVKEFYYDAEIQKLAVMCADVRGAVNRHKSYHNLINVKAFIPFDLYIPYTCDTSGLPDNLKHRVDRYARQTLINVYNKYTKLSDIYVSLDIVGNELVLTNQRANTTRINMSGEHIAEDVEREIIEKYKYEISYNWNSAHFKDPSGCVINVYFNNLIKVKYLTDYQIGFLDGCILYIYNFARVRAVHQFNGVLDFTISGRTLYILQRQFISRYLI